MERITYAALQRDPELLQEIVREAHRARSEALYQLVVAPLVRLFRARPARVPAGPASAKAC